jgi:Ca2+-binding EF-hand superfamily protein
LIVWAFVPLVLPLPFFPTGDFFLSPFHPFNEADFLSSFPFSPQGKTEQEVAEANKTFDEFDADKNGFLDKVRPLRRFLFCLRMLTLFFLLVVFLLLLPSVSSAPDLVAQTEFMAFLKEIGSWQETPEEVEAAIKALDKNGDGKIDREEFFSYWMGQ